MSYVIPMKFTSAHHPCRTGSKQDVNFAAGPGASHPLCGFPRGADVSVRCDVAGSPEHCAARYDGAGVPRARVPRARACAYARSMRCLLASRRLRPAGSLTILRSPSRTEKIAQRASHAVAPCAVPLNTPRVSVCHDSGSGASFWRPTAAPRRPLGGSAYTYT